MALREKILTPFLFFGGSKFSLKLELYNRNRFIIAFFQFLSSFQPVDDRCHQTCYCEVV